MRVSIHPGLRELVLRIRRTPDPAERAAMERMATGLAQLSGHSLAEAVALVDQPGVPAPAGDLQDAASVPIELPMADRIASMLQADPSMSDRTIARTVECSPTVVGRVRKRLGLQGVSRVVKRGNQDYRMQEPRR